MLSIDPTIHYGDILQGFVILVGGFGAFLSIQYRLRAVESELNRLVDIQDRTVRMDERLIALSDRVTGIEGRVR